jgi:hypothetical protein
LNPQTDTANDSLNLREDPERKDELKSQQGRVTAPFSPAHRFMGTTSRRVHLPGTTVNKLP